MGDHRLHNILYHNHDKYTLETNSMKWHLLPHDHNMDKNHKYSFLIPPFDIKTSLLSPNAELSEVLAGSSRRLVVRSDFRSSEFVRVRESARIRINQR
jgi:hypothetical protein